MSDETYYEADGFKSDYHLAEVLVERTLRDTKIEPDARAIIVAAFFAEVRAIRASNPKHYANLRSEMLGDYA